MNTNTTDDKGFTIAGVTGESLRLLAGNLHTMLSIAAVGVAAYILVHFAHRLIPLEGWPGFGCRLLVTLAGHLIGIWAVVAVIVAADSARGGGETLSVKAAFGKALGRWWAYLVCTLLWALATLGGLLLLVIPGIYWGVVYWIGPCEAVLGRERGCRALGRSAELVRPHFWRVFGLIVVVSLLNAVLMLPSFFLDRFVYFGLGRYWVWLLQLIVQPFAISVTVCLYRSLQRCEQQAVAETAADRPAEPGRTGKAPGAGEPAGADPAAQAREEDRLRKQGTRGCLGAVAAALLLIGTCTMVPRWMEGRSEVDPEDAVEEYDTEEPGEAVWSFDMGTRANSSPAIGPDGTVYVGSHNRYLYAVDPVQRTEKWRFRTGRSIRTTPAAGEDGTIYLASSLLYALNPDGSVKWRFYAGRTGSVRTSPAIAEDGTIYFGSDNHNIYALHPEDGSERWKFKTGDSVSAAPVIGDDGTVYAGSADNNLYALDPEDGTEKWRFATGGHVSYSPAIGGDGTIYVGSGDNHLYALEPEGGSEKWRFEAKATVRSPVLGADGTVYAGACCILYALEPEDGVKVWEFKASGCGMASSPAVGDDGTIYLGSWDQTLYALSPEDGTVRWKFRPGGWMSIVDSSPVIDEDGILYISCFDGKMYALRSGSRGMADSPWPMYRREPRRTGRQR